MPRYQFKNLYVPSFGTHGDAQGAPIDPPPPPPVLTLNYERIDFSRTEDTFVFTTRSRAEDASVEAWQAALLFSEGQPDPFAPLNVRHGEVETPLEPTGPMFWGLDDFL